MFGSLCYIHVPKSGKNIQQGFTLLFFGAEALKQLCIHIMLLKRNGVPLPSLDLMKHAPTLHHIAFHYLFEMQ